MLRRVAGTMLVFSVGFDRIGSAVSGDIGLFYESADCSGRALVRGGDSGLGQLHFARVLPDPATGRRTAYYASVPLLTRTVQSLAFEGDCTGIGTALPYGLCCSSPGAFDHGPLGPAVPVDVSAFTPPFLVK